MNPGATQPEKSFRLFVTDGRGRIDKAALEVSAPSDEAAIAKAVEMVGRVPFELWDGARRVVTPGHGERNA